MAKNKFPEILDIDGAPQALIDQTMVIPLGRCPRRRTTTAPIVLPDTTRLEARNKD
jgi:hypothetical protein